MMVLPMLGSARGADDSSVLMNSSRVADLVGLRTPRSSRPCVVGSAVGVMRGGR